ncbi:MAG: metal-sensing transcriptional repressor [Erysipelotrichia bacterium]|jgi:DNA-binding FrmR family transcriptional regulator|nr:metal-sensing transcriptional repressor [Erysipelotrichia bacterium]
MGGVEVDMKHQEAMKTLKVAKGQLDAVISMIENQRYCIDISNQVQATLALLKKAQKQIISEHLDHCVRESFLKNSSEEKIEEIQQLLDRIL